MQDAPEAIEDGDSGQLWVTPKSPLAEILEIVNVPAPVLVMTMGLAALTVLTVCELKFSEVGARLASPWIPVPERLTACGVSAALSLRVMLAVFAPVLVGANLACTKQTAFTAKVVPQEFTKAKSEVLAPVSVMELIVKVAVPLLVTVTVLRGFCEPTCRAPKAIAVVDNRTAPAVPLLPDA